MLTWIANDTNSVSPQGWGEKSIIPPLDRIHLPILRQESFALSSGSTIYRVVSSSKKLRGDNPGGDAWDRTLSYLLLPFQSLAQILLNVVRILNSLRIVYSIYLLKKNLVWLLLIQNYEDKSPNFVLMGAIPYL